MKVLLVGNYEFDGAKSMQIWAQALLRELTQRGLHVQLIAPNPIFGKISQSPVGFGKWLGYIDRFLIFPRQLRTAAAKADVIHICDHGSAMFALRIKDKPILVTCHDLLAVRGALGEIPEMRPSLPGRVMQLWIRTGIQRATKVACVSQFTLDDARRILPGSNLCKVLNGLNYPFRPLEPSEVDRRLHGLSGIDHPFVVHVGSSHPRKNRDCVLRVFKAAAKQNNLRLVFAGRPLSRDLAILAGDLQIADRIVQVTDPTVEVIEALYNRAVALLFPSRYEGFGWPAIEAQACGCPVVGSNIPPLAEVLGESALLHSLEDESGMAESIEGLAANHELRAEIRQRGLENVHSRFQTSRMMEDYLALYRELVPRG
jgi:glycosyltransferase involved in cell wall biosynthesis